VFKDPTFRGLFLVITGNAPAPIWEVKRTTDGRITEIRHHKNWPFVKHYHFHIMDRQWGHVTIRMCEYLPFRAHAAVRKGLNGGPAQVPDHRQGRQLLCRGQ
jgi:hypothetical protein